MPPNGSWEGDSAAPLVDVEQVNAVAIVAQTRPGPGGDPRDAILTRGPDQAGRAGHVYDVVLDVPILVVADDVLNARRRGATLTAALGLVAPG